MCTHADSHFYWSSVLYGYLVYDTLYSLAFFKPSSAAVMLAHHLVGLAGCGIGLYGNKLALFGTAISVWFESCNPLLHVSTNSRLFHGIFLRSCQ